LLQDSKLSQPDIERLLAVFELAVAANESPPCTIDHPGCHFGVGRLELGWNRQKVRELMGEPTLFGNEYLFFERGVTMLKVVLDVDSIARIDNGTTLEHNGRFILMVGDHRKLVEEYLGVPQCAMNTWADNAAWCYPRWQLQIDFYGQEVCGFSLGSYPER
jgi:hypothetical protein